jgi:hypothetical protein
VVNATRKESGDWADVAVVALAAVSGARADRVVQDARSEMAAHAARAVNLEVMKTKFGVVGREKL